MPCKRSYTDGEFGQIHYRVAEARHDGGRPPLHCLHQSPKSGKEFETFLDAASADRTVVALDYPGYGMSDTPPSEDAATIPAYARAAWQVADALGHHTIDVLGNHTGAKVALEMASQRPERIHAGAMVSAALFNDEERQEFADFFEPIPLDKAGTRFTTMWERIQQFSGPGMTLEMMAESLRQNMMGGEAYEWGHAAAFAWGEPFEEALRTLPHPKILLNPADELASYTRRAEAIMTNGKIVECPQWGHGFLELHAKDAAELVLNELDGV